MQDYELIITPESHNLKKELNNYAWSNRKAGVPIDNYNHCIDAARYIVDRLCESSELFIG